MCSTIVYEKLWTYLQPCKRHLIQGRMGDNCSTKSRTWKSMLLNRSLTNDLIISSLFSLDYLTSAMAMKIATSHCLMPLKYKWLISLICALVIWDVVLFLNLHSLLQVQAIINLFLLAEWRYQKPVLLPHPPVLLIRTHKTNAILY